MEEEASRLKRLKRLSIIYKAWTIFWNLSQVNWRKK